MATLKYLLQSKVDNAQIYVRLSAGRAICIKKKTGFVIDSKQWSESKGFPKQSSAENKKLTSSLNELSTYIFDQFNEDISKGVLIDSNWLGACIDSCFNRIDKTDRTLFLNFIDEVINSIDLKQTRGGRIGLSKGTVKNYRMFRNIIHDFQNYLGKQIQFKDINKSFCDKFKSWLIDIKKYSINYSGKQFEFIKTICLDAQKNEIEISQYSISLKPFREQDSDRYIHTLNFNDLHKVINTEMPSQHLNEVKKWLLIGCYIGQRGGDLLNLDSNNLRVNSKGVYIDLIQQKTNKNVTIGVSEPFVLNILLNEFPQKVSLNKINAHISKVCELSGIDELVEGYVIDSKTRRRSLKVLPKYNFITSHSFRRSFASNFYKKIPTSILIGITGHSTEGMFLKYINQRVDKDSNADLFMQYFEKMNEKVEPILRVVNN